MKRVIILAITLALGYSSVVHAEKIDNDGEVMENPYGVCEGIPPSYDLEYYDCYIPYAMTCEEIGGYTLVSLYDGGWEYAKMSEEDKKRKVGDKVNYQKDYSSLNGVPRSKYEEETGGSCIYADSHGNEVYGFAIQQFFYRYESAYYGWSSANRGQLVDVVLTDGTVIHFAVGDANASNHTNGFESPTSAAVSGQLAELNYSQYQNIFSAPNANTIELWGRSGECVNAFMSKYGLKLDGSGVHIAFYRMYNGKLSENIEREEGVGTDPSYKVDGVSISSSGSDDQSEGVGSSGRELIGQGDLIGMEGTDDRLSNDAGEIVLPDSSSLSKKEQLSVSSIREDVEGSLPDKIIYNLRVGIVFVGLALWLYMIIFILGVVFDVVVPFGSIRVLPIITLGRIDIAKDLEIDRHLAYKKVIVSCILMFVVGGVLISGGIYSIVQKVITSMIDLVWGG